MKKPQMPTVLFAFLAALLAAGSGSVSQAEEKQGGDVRVAMPPAIELDENARKLLQRVDDTIARSIPSDEHPVVPDVKHRLTTRTYVLTDAFAATGYRVEALRKQIDKSSSSVGAHVELTLWDNIPETARLFDETGTHANTVEYFWNSQRQVSGAAYKTASDRLKSKHIYCQGSDALYVHDLSPYRIHAPYTRKLTITEQSLTVEFVDGHAPDGSLWFWPRCRELARHQESATAYQSPWGLHRRVFRFDTSGNLIEDARYDAKGKPAVDLWGVARRSWKWSKDVLSAKAVFSNSGLLAAYRYSHDDGKRDSKTRIDTNGTPIADFLGVATYRYERDEHGRIIKETRLDPKGETKSVNTFDYGVLDQVARHAITDASGKVQTTYVHTFNQQGARTSLTIYDGPAESDRLKLDQNGVAVYRFEYNGRGMMTRVSRHGTTKVAAADGSKDYVLVNGHDGWAVTEYAYDKNGIRKKGTRRLEVDEQGQLLDDSAEKQKTISSRFFSGAPLTAMSVLASALKGAVLTADINTLNRRLDELVRKRGDLQFDAYPADAEVTIVQRRFVEDPLSENPPWEWANPVQLPKPEGDDEEERADGEYSFDDLPIREEGRLCTVDNTVYPASQKYCPDSTECTKEAYWQANQDRCRKHKLTIVTRCLADGTYRIAPQPGFLTCADGKTLADPASVPQFTYRYDLLIEREGHYPLVFTISEQDWGEYGSYRVHLPMGVLPRQLGATAKRFATVKRQMSCWRRDWEDVANAQMRQGIVSRVANWRATQAKAMRDRDADIEQIRTSCQNAAPISDSGLGVGSQVLDCAQRVLQLQMSETKQAGRDTQVLEGGLAEFKKALEELRQKRRVNRPTDPSAYMYLADLAWLHHSIDNDKQAALILERALRLDWGLFQKQRARLRQWADTRSRVLGNFRRNRKLADSVAKTPGRAEKALEGQLTTANPLGLLLDSLESAPQTVLSAQVADAEEKTRDELVPQFQRSYAAHLLEQYKVFQKEGDFDPGKWEALLDELKSSGTHGKWIVAMEQSILNRRLDCRDVTYSIPESFLEHMEGQSWQ